MRKRGFTLIELLAVIVILAIIALIATPIIMNVIENTKEASYDRSVEGVLHSAEILAMDMKVTEDLELDKNIYDKIVNQISGDRPDTGQVYINKKGEIALSLRYGDYCYTKSYGEKSYYKEKTEDDCITPHYYLPKTTVTGVTDNENVYFLNELGDELKPKIKKSEIEKIVTMSTSIVPEGVLESWSVGVDKDNNPVKDKIMVWYKDEDNNGLYEVYIGQEGGVKANPNSSRLFSYLANLTEIDLSKLDTSNVTQMNNMFQGAIILSNLDLSNFDTSKVTSMNGMFWGSNKLNTLDLSHFDTSNVLSMSSMFRSCSNLTKLDVSKFNTNAVTNMSYMFAGCSSLESLYVGNLNTSNVTNMSYMFANCKNLKSLNLSKFNTNSVTNMSSMFYYCSSLTKLDVSKFNTNSVTNMSSMFSACTNLTSLDLRNFDVSKVTDVSNIFKNCKNLTEILVSDKWVIENATTTDMFDGCGTDRVIVK